MQEVSRQKKCRKDIAELQSTQTDAAVLREFLNIFFWFLVECDLFSNTLGTGSTLCVMCISVNRVVQVYFGTFRLNRERNIISTFSAV